MKRTIVLATLAIALGSSTAFASENCNVARMDRQQESALTDKLEAKEHRIRGIKQDGDCYGRNSDNDWGSENDSDSDD